jgi:hypothetical protein
VASSPRRRGDPAKICKTSWPGDPRAAELLVKSAVSPTSTSDYPATAVADTLRSLAPGSAAMKLFERGRILDLSGVTQITIPNLASAPASPVFVSEMSPAPVVNLALTGSVLGPSRKILIIAALSDELQDAAPDAASMVIGRALSDAANKSIDATAFDANAGSTTRPAGLLYNVAPITAATAGSDALAQDISALTAAIGAAGIDTANVVFVASPREAMMMKVKVCEVRSSHFPVAGLAGKNRRCLRR